MEIKSPYTVTFDSVEQIGSSIYVSVTFRPRHDGNLEKYWDNEEEDEAWKDL